MKHAHGAYIVTETCEAWRAWQAALQSREPVVDEGTTTPPCDCIENVNGRWVQSCECRNTGDLLSAQDWCTYNNLLSAGAVATQQPATKHCACEWSASGKLEQECIGHRNHRLSQAPQPVVDVNQQLIDALLPFVQNSSVQALVPVTCEIAEEALLKAGKGAAPQPVVDVNDLKLLIANYDFFESNFVGTVDFDPTAARNRVVKALLGFCNARRTGE
jgi:hypothetical protein